MALAPKADSSGQRLLAVAGFGVEARRADFTIFRLPGIERIGTGEIAARVLPPSTDDPNEPGHRNTILCMAFDPTGLVLATGSVDAKAILWDVIPGDRLQVRPRATLVGHNREIRTLAFSPDGKRLATAGGDGSLRLWDVAQGTQVDARLGHPQKPDPINSLAFSPDGGSIVVGREVGTERGGKLYRFDAGNLARVSPVELPSSGEQGPVECVAYHPDGRQLAVSIKSDRSAAIDAMTISSDLEIRAMPEGRLTHRRRVHGLVYTCGFSPSGDRLAYSGGTSQSIFIQEMSDLTKPPGEMRGEGSTPFDLGFKADESQVLGFTRALSIRRSLPRITRGSTWRSGRPGRCRRTSSGERSRNTRAGSCKETSASTSWRRSMPMAGGRSSSSTRGRSASGGPPRLFLPGQDTPAPPWRSAVSRVW